MADVCLHHVVKNFGQVAVIKGISLEIADGEFCVFVGPSGCGKSTLLRLIAGLEDISSGELLIGGVDMTDVDSADRGVAMVFQSYALYPHMTVRENIGFGLKMTKHPKADIERRTSKAADMLQLTPLLDRKPSQLSGGQRQRVAIGRAIVRQPQVFLFDEPLSNLDASLRVQMRIEISKLHQDLAATMIYVTHDQVEAMTMADKIVVLNNGLVEQIGSPLTLYHQPDNLFVAGFLGSPKMNFIPARAHALNAKTLRVELGDLGKLDLPMSAKNSAGKNTAGENSAGEQSVTLGIRPEYITIGKAKSLNLPLKVLVVEYLGSETMIHGTLVSGTELTLKAEGTTKARPGDVLEIGITAAACHVFDEKGKSIRHSEVM